MSLKKDTIDSSSVTWQTKRQKSSPPDLRFLHFNDVYHIEPGSAEPVGGYPRFQYLVNQYRDGLEYKSQPDLISLFSGDAFNPSLESSVTKGKHMLDILNNLPTAMACIGNHDLDFGVTQFMHLKSLCNFPWLLANVLDPGLGTDVPLGDCLKTAIIESSNGVKIGFIGLAEQEWLDTINSLPPGIVFKDATETAKLLVPELRAQGAEIIVALTHMREPNDIKLAETIPSGLIDIVLGGHDHYYAHHYINGVHVLRSGSDFKQLSYIEARRKDNSQSGWDFDIIRRDVIRAIPEDLASVEVVAKMSSILKQKLEKPIGYTMVPLDGRFVTVRAKESNFANFASDLMRYYYNADCAIMAGGTMRSDQIYTPGVLQIKDVMKTFPFEDPVVVVRVLGKNILAALENGVSLVPALEGRYPQVSNIQFQYDPTHPPGSRVMWAKINKEPLDLEKKYTVATRGYMARGKDGYDSLLIRKEGGEAEEIISEESGVLISMILRQYFMSLKVLGRWTTLGPEKGAALGDISKEMDLHHGRDAATSAAADSASRKAQQDGGGGFADSDDEPDEPDEPKAVNPVEADRKKVLARKVVRKWMKATGLKIENVEVVDTSASVPLWTKGIAPRVEGRIINISAS